VAGGGGKLPAHLDGDGLVKYFSMMAQGSETLTAYVLSAAHEGGYAIPEALEGRMESALLAFVQGKVVRYSACHHDLAVRKIAALEAFRVRADTGWRAGIVHGAAESVADFRRHRLVPDPASSPQLPQRAQRWAQADQILRSRLNLQGTTMTFSTERTDDWWWLMSSADSNANRLLLAMADNPAGRMISAGWRAARWDGSEGPLEYHGQCLGRAGARTNSRSG
jgi:hypothetical protein